MPNLLDKLNTLVKASLNNFVDETTGKLLPSGRGPRLGKDIDGEIVALRKRIDQAISEEDGMKLRIGDMDRQIALTDQQIDEALKRGDDANARLLSQQMQTKQRQSSILQADLEEHRRATSDLIQHVNTLEAMVADARHEQQQSAQAGQSSGDQTSEAQPEQQSSTSLSALLRDARERVETMLPGTPQEPAHHIPIHIETDTPAAETSDNAVDSQIDADLAKRRSRLSKPDQPQKSDKTE